MEESDSYRRRFGRILVVEDDAKVRQLLVRQLEQRGHDVVTTSSGEQAIRVLADGLPDLMLVDVQLPGITGFDLCRRIKEAEPTRLIPFVLITGLGSLPDRLIGIRAGADDYLTKPYHVDELDTRIQSLLRLKEHTDELESAEDMILSLALTIEARDAYTYGHCERLAHYASLVGQELGLSPDMMKALRIGGYLHDLGKVAVSDSILCKQGPLTREERELVHQHPVIGETLCGTLRSLRLVRPIVRHHHELLDGSGYPDRLRGDEVPLGAQIVGLVDVYDALTTARPYRHPLTHALAVAVLVEDATSGRRRLDLVEAFLAPRSRELERDLQG